MLPRRRSRLPRILLALLAGLFCAELGLRAAGWIYLALAGKRGGAAERDGSALLCLGDSHVFGLYERPEDSWPAQLQGLLDAHAQGRWSVENAGRPGASSLDVARRIDGDLERLRPAAVVVTVGVNDEWSYTGSEELLPPRPPWHEQLHLTKLARLLAHRMSRGRDEVPEYGTPVDAPVRNADFYPHLLRNLLYVRGRCEAQGAPLLLVAYATDRPACAAANEALRKLARDEGFALCDATLDVARLEEQLGLEQAFHLDLHPRAPAYTAIARAAYESLRELGVVRGNPPGATLEPARDDALRMRLAGSLSAAPGEPDALTLWIEGGEPGSRFRVVLFGLRERGAPAPAELADVQRDPLLRATLNRDDLAGVFDGDGRASVALAHVLDRELGADFAGLVLQAACLEHAVGDQRRVTRVPPAVTLELR